MTLSDRQCSVFMTLAQLLEQHRRVPTYQEIGDALGIASPSTISYHVGKLHEAGLIDQVPFQSRSTTLTEKGERLWNKIKPLTHYPK